MSKYCVQLAHNPANKSVYKNHSYTPHCRLPAITTMLSPISSPPDHPLNTLCTRLFHTTIFQNISVNHYFSSLSTVPTTATTIYINN
jgi:hypothetical protein